MATKFTKIRAGWYETTPVPAAGTFAVHQYENEWNISRYSTSDIDGGLDLASTGEAGATFEEAKATVRWILEDEMSEA